MRRLLWIAGLCAILGLAVILYTGDRLAAPAMREVGPPPPGLPAEAIEFAGGSGPIRGWFIPGTPGGGAVLLLHAIRSDRRAMVGRARFLHHAGHAALMIDLQAHGESPGAHITFGYREAQDALAAARYLKRRLPDERIAVIGVSLGAAAAVLSRPTLPADAFVLEAAYPTLRRAVENRIAIRLGDEGRMLAPLLLWQVRARVGFDPDILAPIERIAAIDKPVLIIGGAADRHTTPGDTHALFATAREPKSLWIVDGAGHQDFHTHTGRRYEQRILDFLAHHLR